MWDEEESGHNAARIVETAHTCAKGSQQSKEAEAQSPFLTAEDGLVETAFKGQLLPSIRVPFQTQPLSADCGSFRYPYATPGLRQSRKMRSRRAPAVTIPSLVDRGNDNSDGRQVWRLHLFGRDGW